MLGRENELTERWRPKANSRVISPVLYILNVRKRSTREHYFCEPTVVHVRDYPTQYLYLFHILNYFFPFVDCNQGKQDHYMYRLLM